ncbi:Protein EPIDERMAL PATTERNING FACTOR 2 [Ranunculus cassubicifolius]
MLGISANLAGMESYPTGSTLPDCMHACGPCSPCKRVMVSSTCLMVESCAVVYRCMCKGRYYQIPSS